MLIDGMKRILYIFSLILFGGSVQVPFGNVQVKEPRDMLKLVGEEPACMTHNSWPAYDVKNTKKALNGIIEFHLSVNMVPTNSLKTSFQGFPPDSVMLKPLHEWKPPKLPLIVSDNFNVPNKRLDEVLDAVCKEYSIKWRLEGNVIVFVFCAIPLDSVLPECLPGGPVLVSMDHQTRVYTRKIGQMRTCLMSPYSAATVVEALPEEEFSVADAVTSATMAWHYMRYKMADRHNPHLDVIDVNRNFPRYASDMFFVQGQASRNIVMRLFPFVVSNPASKHELRCCLVTISGTYGFICALYVNLNTGKIGLRFGPISGRLPLVSRESDFPFLTPEEYARQKDFFPRPSKTVKHKERCVNQSAEGKVNQHAPEHKTGDNRLRLKGSTDINDVEVDVDL